MKGFIITKNKCLNLDNITYMAIIEIFESNVAIVRGDKFNEDFYEKDPNDSDMFDAIAKWLNDERNRNG